MSNACSCNKRILSNAITNNQDGCECFDVCTHPKCGDPCFLTVLTPVCYDEIGINICRSFDLPEGTMAAFPTAVCASAEVIDITFATAGTDAVTITPIATRPNCYEVVLTNLSVTFAVKLFDCCNRLLTTLTVPNILYLPPETTNPSFDEDTNPNEVTLELFAPYGVSYTDGNVALPSLNFIGFSTTNNTMEQGLNMMAIPKVLDFDIADGSITMGLTVVVKVIYYLQYQLPHKGKAIISKGSLSPSDTSICMEFVEGSLLDRNIKPLELLNPTDTKENCDTCQGVNPCDCESDMQNLP